MTPNPPTEASAGFFFYRHTFAARSRTQRQWAWDSGVLPHAFCLSGGVRAA